MSHLRTCKLDDAECHLVDGGDGEGGAEGAGQGGHDGEALLLACAANVRTQIPTGLLNLQAKQIYEKKL